MTDSQPTDSPLTAAQTASWASYQRLRAQLGGHLNRELTRHTGLSEADYEILLALSESPQASVRAMALRCGLEWEKSRLSHQLRRMETRGLVSREGCPEDNRGSFIRLTDKGRQSAADARSHHEQAIRQSVVNVLTPQQLEDLGRIADAILGGLEATHRA
ncbi:MarR family transcriptional regulator [Cryobacterium sp. CG_9.6]|uniref:MarR family winged helix-turn-helix transcriptional regulator n=1 Tax=Cryobacterium sp. CG_9.6 TaxID=2760710 RepID=UPI0024765F9C|nr:MarR family transcriptional regulator [Cryobacterium sp. CG_9.6]MDH6235488.1 DNA-binding MarR family transcriptional regulator [Cryobacterium sp. CG_9.6]